MISEKYVILFPCLSASICIVRERPANDRSKGVNPIVLVRPKNYPYATGCT
eukprot:c51734_g1_i1 orf=179-331(+)